ncbi:MAG: UDP-N-acetylmuramate--L-alanine ligase [Bacteroidetes bacterium HGW-Bacteroidetes-2]|jgi:UDP-N-acetylmuramate--alanine ligase|nr:MAG: UDP-N-acetylmuramate--L-alanine ligase [Bacteroidetes bacterium HGW-Bacteroidetes-2]
MKTLENIQNIYFIGIGGIGMSALARYFNTKGKVVSGYDKTPSEITKALENEGITIHFHEDISIVNALPNKNTLVVYTPAIPVESLLLNGFKNQEFVMMKRAAVLGLITKQTKCLAIAGTHGKTTSTAILGHLLASAHEEVTVFLGGVSENYNSNLILNGSKITVVEADEFDRSFLQLNPYIAGITSMDPDHLDIYGDEAHLIQAFTSFANLVPNKEFLLHKKGLPLCGKTVGIEDNSDYEAQNVRIENGSYVFDLKTPHIKLENLILNLPGRHNLFNATLALGMAICLGSPTSGMPEALFNFKGVQRRFTYKIKTENLVLIDDYAHHPSEINAVYQAVKEMYPNKKNLVVFQPHLFSRTHDFGDAFAASLTPFDEIILLDIYPAREKPMKGITSQWLLNKIKNNHKKLSNKTQLIQDLKNSSATIILMLGAGDIGEVVETIKNKLIIEN